MHDTWQTKKERNRFGSANIFESTCSRLMDVFISDINRMERMTVRTNALIRINPHASNSFIPDACRSDSCIDENNSHWKINKCINSRLEPIIIIIVLSESVWSSVLIIKTPLFDVIWTCRDNNWPAIGIQKRRLTRKRYIFHWTGYLKRKHD